MEFTARYCATAHPLRTNAVACFLLVSCVVYLMKWNENVLLE
jgi:hypothetical protein